MVDSPLPCLITRAYCISLQSWLVFRHRQSFWGNVRFKNPLHAILGGEFPATTNSFSVAIFRWDFIIPLFLLWVAGGQYLAVWSLRGDFDRNSTLEKPVVVFSHAGISYCCIIGPALEVLCTPSTGSSCGRHLVEDFPSQRRTGVTSVRIAPREFGAGIPVRNDVEHLALSRHSEFNGSVDLVH